MYGFKLLPLAAIWALGNSQDVFIFSVFFVSRNWEVLARYITAYVDPTSLVDILKCSLSALVIIQVVRFIRGLSAASTPVEDGLPRPMLFPSRTSHTRLFPKKNTFSYSYLLAGVPIGWKGSSGGMLSADLPKKNDPWYWKLLSITPDPSSTWYSVDAEDYMEPGHVELGLDGKLWRYLETQVRAVCVYRLQEADFCIGGPPRRFPIRLPCDGCQIHGLRFESCFLLASLWPRQGVESLCGGSQQHFQ